MDERDELQALLTPTAAILLPLGQAGVTGLAGIAIGAGWAAYNHLPSTDVVGVSTLVGAATFTGAWIWGLRWWQRRIEMIGSPTAPQQATVYQSNTVRIDAIKDYNTNYWHGVSFDLPISHDRMIELANLIKPRMEFGHWIAGTKLVTRTELLGIREEFLKVGFLRWKNPHSHAPGVEFTGSGRSFIRQYALLSSENISVKSGRVL